MNHLRQLFSGDTVLLAISGVLIFGLRGERHAVAGAAGFS